MLISLSTVEKVLRSDSRLRVIYDEAKELSFESISGLQIAINRQSTKNAIRLWIENVLNPKALPFSENVKFQHYPASQSRAPKLTGPYTGRRGNDCWYISITEEADLRVLLSAYLLAGHVSRGGQSSAASVPIVASVPIGEEEEEHAPEEFYIEEDEEARFPEGSASYRIHRHLERDGSLPIRAKKKRLKDTGTLSCDVCGFDFLNRYGEVGAGYIEAHHTKPVSTLKEADIPTISDLALVCSNCHRMLHRGGSPMAIDQLRQLYDERKEI